MKKLKIMICLALILSLLMSFASCRAEKKNTKGEGSSLSSENIKGSSSRDESGSDESLGEEPSLSGDSSEMDSSDTSANTAQSGQNNNGSNGNNGTANGPNAPSQASYPSSVTSKNNGSSSKNSSQSSSLTYPPYTGPLMNVRNTGDAHTLGVWWWSLADINSTAGDMYLDFLAKNKVSEIYLCVDQMGNSVSVSSVKAFVKKAKQNGMRVAALAGDVSWINAGNSGFESFLTKFKNYQASASSDEKFYAMHLDVEPHQRSDFAENRKIILQLLADLLTKKARPAATASGTLLEWDIPFWYKNTDIVEDETKAEIRIDELFAKKCDTVAVMSYRDTANAMYNESKDEIAFAKKYGTKIILGAETKSSEGNSVSYMEEGKVYMNSEMLKLKNLLDSGVPSKKYGMAIHQHKTWYGLKN